MTNSYESIFKSIICKYQALICMWYKLREVYTITSNRTSFKQQLNSPGLQQVFTTFSERHKFQCLSFYQILYVFKSVSTSYMTVLDMQSELQTFARLSH